MTRKDYELIASVIAALRNKHPVTWDEPEAGAWEDCREMAAIRLATAFEVDNPAFRRDIFMEACNIPGWKKTTQLLRK